MPDNRFPPNLLSTASDVLRRAPAPRPSLAARVTARLRAHQLDRQLAVGVQAHPASALAVHQARLTSVAEREKDQPNFYPIRYASSVLSWAG